MIAIANASKVRFLSDDNFSAISARLPLAEVFNGYTPVSELSGKAVTIPGLGRIAALSCEPVTEIANIFRHSPDDLILGYEGNVFGYLPVDSMIAEGGYEPFGFMPAFNLRGSWKPSLDRRLEDFSKLLHI